ncbi:uncharacterized protein EURHEDRAFT_388265 [Aspergillus ruber CBS 135680]|uniref:Uncharacterized protein n=1 Tax=Aspergillus ruber (strain CBS 135680) TaxID=1388766 RepID=A0A017S873_ASPRC|nr:uncharacterized protein EURHEDRAFT_388265 [Aspergillus ruber CBS 135680]EYE92834.1 hypothetical protein EURHEDRAFT_388265 [Aspergillus ruber CBS 135680]
MAAVTMSTPARQPFASLDAPRLRALAKSRMNIRNQQNGAMITGKRKPLGDIDTENIDPTLNLSSKRKRGSDENDDLSSKKTSTSTAPPKPLKTSRFALKTIETSPSAPRISSLLQPSTPKSTPSLKPAGRSPRSLKSICKPFARRSNITKGTHPEPTGRKSVSRPFSIATALSSGKSQKTAAPATPSTKTPAPASWSFDIHVDSEEEEMTNLMQHSTGVLDISDSEAKQDTSSGRGKENVPPAELGLELAPAAPQQESPAAAARKSVMMEESRAPLGELNAADYYGADCHAFSYAVVWGEEEETGVENAVPVQTRKSASRGSTKPARGTKLSSVSSISSLEPAASKEESAKSERSETGIEIYESESAAEEESA